MRLLLVIFLFFGGCATKHLVRSYPVLFVMKSKAMKISGTGFIERKGPSWSIDLYSAGSPLFRMKLTKRVCIEKRGCFSYVAFNEHFLDANYPSSLIADIIAKRPIFQGEGIRKTEDGFIQHIESQQFDIIYRVKKDEVYFKDKKNKILIKIRKLHG